MKRVYHVLNGDALKEQFPDEIDGEIIVLRECLVDGPVQAGSLESLFEQRATFISAEYTDEGPSAYMKSTARELQRLPAIEKGSEVNFWFEDDLFCQVNFWFAIHTVPAEVRGFLVRPDKLTMYGFAAYQSDELNELHRNRVPLNNRMRALWPAYQQGEMDQLVGLAKELSEFPFIMNAVEAHIGRLPKHKGKGSVEALLIDIMHDLQTRKFGPVFGEFCRRAPIYGFGDLQIKRIFDKLVISDQP